jgi:hypothetical protein
MPVASSGRSGPSHDRSGRTAAVVGVLGLTFAALVWVARALAGSRPPAWAGSSGRADTAAPGANLAPGQHAAPPQPTPDLDGAPLRPGWYGFALLVIAVVAAGCAIFLYNWLSQWHWPVTLTASATVSAPHESILQDLELTAGMNGSPVRWLVDSGSARQLTVSGPDTGTAEIILPLRRSWCARMAARLKASCGGGQLSLNSPVTFDWSNTQQFASTDAPQRTVSSRLDITEAIARPGVLEMEVTAVTRARPSLCFSSPLNAVTLRSLAARFTSGTSSAATSRRSPAPQVLPFSSALPGAECPLRWRSSASAPSGCAPGVGGLPARIRRPA